MWRSTVKSCKIVALALSLVAVTVSLSFAAPFQVTSASLNATPAAYDGVCPATIKFNGTISANTYPGVIKYIFTRSDGAMDTVVKTVTLSTFTATSGSVQGTWTLGDPVKLPTYTGWMSIKVLSPNPMESNKANFKVVCSKK